MGRKITVWVLIVVTVALIGYDVWAAARGYNFTITNFVRTLSAESPVVPFGIGVLLGYWLAKLRASEGGNNGVG